MYVFPAKKHCFSSVFAKRTSKNIEFFQIFGKRMQEAQASKKAGRGNRAWDPCFATPAPRRLRLVERHQIAARYVGDPPPPPQKTYVIDVGRGGVRGGVILYPLVSIRHAEQCRRILENKFPNLLVSLRDPFASLCLKTQSAGQVRTQIPFPFGFPQRSVCLPFASKTNLKFPFVSVSLRDPFASLLPRNQIRRNHVLGLVFNASAEQKSEQRS